MRSHFYEEGYFFIKDRLKRIVNSSGYKVSPSEVESLLYRHPAIQEACVVGAPDSYRGEMVKAFVVVKADYMDIFSSEELMSWARRQMAAYKVPRAVQVVNSLPKSASGKILWKALQDTERAAHNVHLHEAQSRTNQAPSDYYPSLTTEPTE